MDKKLEKYFFRIFLTFFFCFSILPFWKMIFLHTYPREQHSFRVKLVKLKSEQIVHPLKNTPLNSIILCGFIISRGPLNVHNGVRQLWHSIARKYFSTKISNSVLISDPPSRFEHYY